MAVDVYLYNQIYATLDPDPILHPRFHFDFYNFVSFFDEKTKYTDAVRRGFWDGRVSFYNRETHRLPLGLLGYLVTFCNRHKIELNYRYEPSVLRDLGVDKGLKGFFGGIFKSGFRLREYQEEAILRGLREKRGVICAATSSGKSAQIYAISRFLVEKRSKKVLIIVPTVGLVDQLFDNFREYGWENVKEHVCILRSGKLLDINKDIIITTYQSFTKYEKVVYEEFGAVLVDEAHLAKGASIQKILKRCLVAEWRLGFTGTLPRDQFETAKIMSVLGPKLFEVKTEELQKENFVAQCRIVNLMVKYNEDDSRFLRDKSFFDILDPYGEEYDWEKIPENFRPFFDAMPVATIKRILARKIAPFYVESGLVNYNPKRLKVLDYIYTKVPENQNVLILVQEIQHFEDVLKYLKGIRDEGSIFCIRGDVKPEEREGIRGLVERGEGVTILATFGTMSTGISITTLEHIVLFKSFRSEIRTLQTIGRGLRLNPRKEYCVIWDVIDDLSSQDDEGKWFFNFCFKHWLGKSLPGNDYGRLDYYKEQKFPMVKQVFPLD